MAERFFNTAGPNVPAKQYTLDPLSRIDLDEMLEYINQGKYFILHAPRQTGKTSCLLALRDYLNERGEYIAVYVNVEGGQSMRNDISSVISGLCQVITDRLSSIIGKTLPYIVMNDVKQMSVSVMLYSYLRQLSENLPKPLVLFIDEIDSLVGDPLVSVLRQIRSGYDERPARFPQTVVLCGVRDVRDYRIVTSNQDIITGGSAFNIKAASLRLGNFTPEDIRELYGQHTAETGQFFEEECFPLVWEATEGQPWLVNALANEVTYNMRENRDRSVRITAEMMYRAQENIIYRRDTHIDILIDKLREPRVRRVIEPILANSENMDDSQLIDDDIQYVEDMGLIKRERGRPIRISCGIYREIIPRELTWKKQQTMVTEEPAWYLKPDGSLDMEKLLADFQQFFRQNADSWIQTFDYAEAGPQLLLQAFLQRVVNGGGYIDREYGLGRRRTDLLIRKPLTDGYGGPIQRVVLELKILRGDLEATIEKGLEQTAAYMDLSAADEGHFIVFDRTKTKTWDERIWHQTRSFNGREIMVWGM